MDMVVCAGVKEAYYHTDVTLQRLYDVDWDELPRRADWASRELTSLKSSHNTWYLETITEPVLHPTEVHYRYIPANQS